MRARVEVVPGAGTVLRHGGVVVWVGPGASASLLGYLDRSSRNLGPSARGGSLLAAHLEQVLADRDPEPTAAFAVVGPDDAGGWAILLHGAAQLWDGAQWHRTERLPGWLRVTGAPSGVLLVGPLGASPDPTGSHPLLDLEEGGVPGGGFAVVPVGDLDVPGQSADHSTDFGPGPDGPPAGAGPAALAGPGGTGPTAVLGADRTAVIAGTADATVATSRPADLHRPAGVLGLDAPVPGSDRAAAGPSGPVTAVPVVRGVQCPAGHFNHPAVTACARCARAIDAPDRVVSGPRPPLGVLVVDDGSVWRLDRTYLLGAGPDSDPTVTGGTARALTLPGDRVADAHAELRIGDWAVTLVDRGSAGGTWVLGPGAGTWEQLEAYRQHLLRPGSHVAVGSRVLTYLSPWPG